MEWNKVVSRPGARGGGTLHRGGAHFLRQKIRK